MVFLSWIMSFQIQMEQSEEPETRIRDKSVASTACVQELPPFQISKSAISPLGRSQDLPEFLCDDGMPGFFVEQQVEAGFHVFIHCRQRILEVQVGERSVRLGEEQEVHREHLLTVLASLLRRPFPDTPPHCACPRLSLDLFFRSKRCSNKPSSSSTCTRWLAKQSLASPSAV